MRLQKNTPTRLGKLGQIKVGKTNEKGYPVSIDYFRFASPVQKRVDQLVGVYGKEPKIIQVTFHSNDASEVCSQVLELRDFAGRLIAYGDGTTFYRSTKAGVVMDNALDPKWQGRYSDGLITKYTVPSTESKKGFLPLWTETLIVRMIIVGCTEWGFWEFRTKAKETTIPQIIGTFDTCLNSWGRVAMIPFNLTVEKHKSNGAEVNRNYPVVNLIPDISVEASEKLIDVGSSVRGLLTNEKLINAPSSSPDIEDAEIIQ